jgi:hypothetical protein
VKKLLATLILTLALVEPAAAAYTISCGMAKQAFQFGTDEDQTLFVAYALGVNDMLATLLCFGRDRRCDCLSNIDRRAGDFGRALGQRLVSNCPDQTPVVGTIFNASLDVCR